MNTTMDSTGLHTTEEMLAALEAEPPGAAFGGLTRQTTGGLALTVVVRTDLPLPSPYYILIASERDGEVSPLFNLIVGYPDRQYFEEVVMHAPIARWAGWLRCDENARRSLRHLVVPGTPEYDDA